MNRTRVSVPLSETLYNEIKYKSEQLGITMSSFIAFVVATHLNNELLVTNALSKEVGGSISDLIKKLSELQGKKDGE